MQQIDNEDQPVGNGSISAGRFIMAVADLAKQHGIAPQQSMYLLGLMARMLADRAIAKGVDPEQAIGGAIESFLQGMGGEKMDVEEMEGIAQVRQETLQ
ncbi:MAG: hypothetical protein ACXWVD_00400 [Telluria sp.]